MDEGLWMDMEGSVTREFRSGFVPQSEHDELVDEENTPIGGVSTSVEPDNDWLCPICIQIIKDAFITACGHSFCYTCITTHLQNKKDCPCCGRFLSINQIFPNFVLDKILKKVSTCHILRSASLAEQFRRALQKGCDMSAKDVEILINLLMEKKKKMAREESERNMRVLMDFLQSLRKQKADELDEIQVDLQYIKDDIDAVERQKQDFYRTKEKNASKWWKSTENSYPISNNEPSVFSTCSIVSPHTQKFSERMQNSKPNDLVLSSFNSILNKKFNGSELQPTLADAKKKRVHAQFNELEECYLKTRRNSQDYKHEIIYDIEHGKYSSGLIDFQHVLSTFTRHSQLKVTAEFRQDDIFNSPNIVSSIDFNRDDELFATGGVSRRIKVFNFYSVTKNENGGSPLLEMATQSKLTCLCWSKHINNHIASSDYEGIITVWDVEKQQSMIQYEEHEKRVWSVDFSSKEPSMLLSGSDDCKVKVWCTKQEASVMNIDMNANVCCVKYNPGSDVHIAVGSADHHIHYYDLRNITHPLHVFNGHQKTVSYVNFLSDHELASASTDSTLRLWDLKNNLSGTIFKGHTNEKNFVGLSVNGEYVACGSETNEVFVYHKAISKPVISHSYSTENEDMDSGGSGQYFVSVVCWKRGSVTTLLSANSQGIIRVLELT